VHQQALAQPLTLSPHVTFDCDPIGKPALARRPLQSVPYCLDPLLGSADIIIPFLYRGSAASRLHGLCT